MSMSIPMLYRGVGHRHIQSMRIIRSSSTIRSLSSLISQRHFSLFPAAKVGEKRLEGLTGTAQEGSHFDGGPGSKTARNPGTDEISKKFRAPIDWKDPDILSHFTEIAPGWYEGENPEGRKFYYDRENDTTQWKHPFSGEVTLPPEYKTMNKSTVFGEFRIKNKLQRPLPGQIPHNDPSIDVTNSFGVDKSGRVQINTKSIFIADNPDDQIGKLNTHSYDFETKIQHNNVAVAYTPPIDWRPRKRQTGSSMWYAFLFYLQYGAAVLVLGGFVGFNRWRSHYYGHNQRVYQVSETDKNSYIPEIKWLFGIWKMDAMY